MAKSILEKLTEYFENNSKEKILEDWKAVEKYSKIGPSVDEFLSQAKASMETKEEEIKWNPTLSIDRKQYEDDLQRRQKEHLDNVYNRQNQNWRPCLHDSCPDCLGTGVKLDGSMCIHGISCPCPKCTPYC